MNRIEGDGKMSIYPWYQDVIADVNLQENQLPFKISKHTINRSYPLHHHDFMELSFVLEGHGFEKVNGKKQTLRPGTVTILLPHHIHEIHNEAESPMKLYCCMFDIELLCESAFDSVLGSHLLKTGTVIPSHYYLDSVQALNVQCVLDDMHKEYIGLDFIKHTLIRAKLLEVLILVMRTRFPGEQDDTDRQHIADQKTADKITKIVQYLHLHYREPLSLKTLSKHFCLSVPYISRLFKVQTGQNFIDYFHALRIQRALSLLVTTNMSILEISTDVGFENGSTFSRVFREIMGVTASDYRNHKRQSLDNMIVEERNDD